MNELKFVESDEERIERMIKEKNNITNQLKKSEENGHVAGCVIVFLTICLVSMCIWCGQLQKANRTWQTANDSLCIKSGKVLDKYEDQKALTMELTSFKLDPTRHHTDSIKSNRLHQFDLEERK